MQLNNLLTLVSAFAALAVVGTAAPSPSAAAALNERQIGVAFDYGITIPLSLASGAALPTGLSAAYASDEDGEPPMLVGTVRYLSQAEDPSEA